MKKQSKIILASSLGAIAIMGAGLAVSMLSTSCSGPKKYTGANAARDYLNDHKKNKIRGEHLNAAESVKNIDYLYDHMDIQNFYNGLVWRTWMNLDDEPVRINSIQSSVYWLKTDTTVTQPGDMSGLPVGANIKFKFLISKNSNVKNGYNVEYYSDVTYTDSHGVKVQMNLDEKFDKTKLGSIKCEGPSFTQYTADFDMQDAAVVLEDIPLWTWDTEDLIWEY